MHIYEPVEEFYEKLRNVWRNHSETNQWKVSVHNYGLGDSTRTILLSQADLKGQGTFGMKDTEAEDEKKVKLEIVEATTAINNVTAESEDLDLLHVNCEGCEYEMLENIIQSDTQRKIK